MSQATPVRLGPDSKLFGWLHLPPDGGARSCVVICPPLGGEYMSAYDALRIFAESCAERGLAALRFDYYGTGDSPGSSDDSQRVSRWGRDIREAVDFARGLGLRLAILGMRMGATLAAVEARHLGQLDAAVLWDPCASGRAFLRQQAALSQFIFGAGNGAGIETPGASYSPEAAECLSSVTLSSAPSRIADRTLLLLRNPDRSAAVVEHFSDPCVVCEKVDGQAELLDSSTLEARLPIGTIDQIACWFAAQLPRGVAGDGQVVVPEVRAAVVGSGVTERAVRLGTGNLFGIATEPTAGNRRPVVLFVNAGVEPHVGPARQWVDIARALAHNGLSSFRFDLSGLGDSPPRPWDLPRSMYAKAALSDITETAAAVSPEDPSNVVIVGLSSGAVLALEAGHALGARGVVAINPAIDVRAPTLRPHHSANEFSVVRARPRFAAAVLKRTRFKLLLQRMPPSVWRAAHLLNLGRSPADGLRDVVAAVSDTLVVCAEEESRSLIQRGQWIVEQLTQTGRFHLVVLPGSDHGLLTSAARREVTELIVAHLSGRRVQSALG